MAETLDDTSRALIENYFVYRDEWVVSRIYRCDSGHMTLFSSRLDTGASDTWTCTRYVSGAPCRKSMVLYVPDDEGLTSLQWAKRLLERAARGREEGTMSAMHLVKAIKDLAALTSSQKIAEEIMSRPAVRRVLDWLS